MAYMENRSDFKMKFREYINSLEGADKAMTRDEWYDWIYKEAKEFGEECLDDDGIKEIINILDEEGYVISSDSIPIDEV